MIRALPTHVTLSTKVFWLEIEDEAVSLDLKRGQYYGFNQLGTRIWKLLAEQSTPEVVRAQLLEEYDVEEEELSQDLAEFIAQLAAFGLVHIE